MDSGMTAPQAAVRISAGKVVTLHYTLTDSTGAVLDSTDSAEPFTYLHGSNSIVPGLETQLTGQSAGAALKLVVQPEDGYGVYDSEEVESVPRSAFPAEAELEAGTQIQVQDEEDGEESIAWITEVSDEVVCLDFNHPLAGEVLNFEINIISVRDATGDEITHGHAHGPGGHHHH